MNSNNNLENISSADKDKINKKSIDNNSIDKFLLSVCRFISTEEKAIDIQDELKDHIYSYIEEYTEEGMNEDEATAMALKQMGDPEILSKNFKDKTYKINKLFRMISMLLVTSIFLISDFIYFSINTYKSLEGFLSIFLTILISWQYIREILDFVITYKKDKLLSKEEPLFYIQSYKESIWDERVIKYVQLFFLCICLVLFMSLLGKFNHIDSKEVFSSSLQTINSISFVLLMIMSVSILSPKRKNAIVYDEGILMFNSFIPFSRISGYMWTSEIKNGKTYYSLEFSTKNTSFLDKKSFFLDSIIISNDRAPIKVSSSQVSLLNELFKKHEIKSINN